MDNLNLNLTSHQDSHNNFTNRETVWQSMTIFIFKKIFLNTIRKNDSAVVDQSILTGIPFEVNNFQVKYFQSKSLLEGGEVCNKSIHLLFWLLFCYSHFQLSDCCSWSSWWVVQITV